MTDKIEEKIDKYKEDILPIFEFIPNNYLRITRNKVGGSRDKYRVDIYIDDDTLNTTIKLGHYLDAKWCFDNPNESSLFWRLIKHNHRGRLFLNMVYKMKKFETLNDSSIGFKLRWENRKRKFRRFINKLKK
jgi:hypothetical protein